MIDELNQKFHLMDDDDDWQDDDDSDDVEDE